jgi:hypothetical protein
MEDTAWRFNRYAERAREGAAPLETTTLSARTPSPDPTDSPSLSNH